MHAPCVHDDLHRAHAHAAPRAGGGGGERCVQRVPVEALDRRLQTRLHARGMPPGDGSATTERRQLGRLQLGRLQLGRLQLGRLQLGRLQLVRLREALPKVPRRGRSSSRLGGSLAAGEESTQRAATHLAHRAPRRVVVAPHCVAGGHAHKREEESTRHLREAALPASRLTTGQPSHAPSVGRELARPASAPAALQPRRSGRSRARSASPAMVSDEEGRQSVPGRN
eukprot:scaffold10356_cov61-Phaeocystis_antarctica.AAC.1